MPAHSMKRSTGHVRSWIKANKIKDEFHSDMLSECMQSILKLYGSHKDLLEFLIQHSPKQPLDQMYKILQKTLETHKIKSMMNHKAKSITSLSTNNTNKPLKIDMNRISTTSIEMICGFLTRTQIERFKSCNRAIAIICLNEMMKSSVTVCYATQLLNTKLKPYERCIMMLHHNPSRFNKYNANSTYSFSLPNIVLNPSYIPIAIDSHEKHHIVSNHKIYPKSSLIVFNKADITRIDSKSNNFQQMRTNDVFLDGEHIILALHYFNVLTQEFSLIKYIISDRHVTLEKIIHYITSTLVPNDTTPAFYHLKSFFMNQTSRLKLHVMHMFQPFDPLNESNRFSVSVVQLLKQKQKILSLAFQADVSVDRADQMKYQVATLTDFHTNISSLLNHMPRRLTIKCDKSYTNELKQQMKHCMRLKKQSEAVISDTMQSLDVLEKGIPIRCSNSLNKQIIKHYIARNVLNNMVNAKNIIVPYFARHTTIMFRIVPYDTSISSMSHQMRKTVLSTIRLFPESQAPFPFHSNQIQNNPICFDMKINKSTFIRRIMQNIIKIAQDPVFNYKFISIQATLKKYDASSNSTCYALQRCWRSQYVETESDSDDDEWTVPRYRDDGYEASILYERDYGTINHGATYYDYPEPSQPSISLYLVPTWRSTNGAGLDAFRLMIRFAWSGAIHSGRVEMCDMRKHMIGLPLIVWITTDDSLHDILENNPTIQQYKERIAKTFIVNTKELNVTLIEARKPNAIRFSNDDKSFVIVTLSKRTDKNKIEVDQHCLTSHKPFVLSRFDEYKNV
eukprot:801115_1